jgi:hypothetical protein
VLSFVLGLFLVTPAGSDNTQAPFVNGGDLPTGTPAPTDCATPREGCPCTNEGDTAECGDMKSQSTDYITCAMGTRTCTNRTWGACDASATRTQALSRHQLLALGSGQSCGSTNPCDPYCNSVTDDAQGLSVGGSASVAVNNGGITLIQSQAAAMGTPCTSLSISPSSGTLNVTQFSPISPSTQQFTATLSPAGCYPGTPPVVWAIDQFDIATIDTNGLLTLVSPEAGPIKVTGYAGSLSATATLNVKISVVDVSAAPTGSSTKFTSSTGSSDTAAVLYPYVDTVLPLGLLPPLVQWNQGSTGAAQAVKLSVRYPATGTAIFDWAEIISESRTIPLNPPLNTINLASGPRAQIPQAVWTAFEHTAKGSDALIVLQRLTGTSASPTLRSEIPTRIHFANGQLKGTVYYQSYGTNLVQNFSSTLSSQSIGGGQRFGAATLAINPGATYPTVAAGYTSAADGPGCRVCHTAAAGGTAIVSDIYGSADSMLFRLGVDAPNGGVAFPAKNDGKFAWSALYPDGSFIFGNSGPSQAYSSAAPPGGLEDSAWCNSNSTSPCTSALNGQAPPNALYSLAPSSIGSVISSTGIPSALRAAMPVFSPDGTKIAFNHYAGAVTDTSTGATVTGDKRSLAMMDFSNSTKKFSNFRRLVTQSTSACSSSFGVTDPCTNVWPTFLPGNEGVIFEREVFNNGRVVGSNHSDFGGTRSGCDGTGTCGDDGAKAELWWVTLATPPVVTKLNQANGLKADGSLYLPTNTGTQHTSTVEPVLNYEPTTSPKPVGGYYWVAFTSRRLYGNVATMNPWWSDPRFKPIGGANGPTTKKIWVSAIDQSPGSSGDPSHPAFYLPGQELLAGNSKAYWVLNACTTASNTRTTATQCETDLDCCGAPTTAVCSLQTPITNPPVRNCIPVSTASCIADNSSTQCSSDAQCCGFSTGSRCANGVCKLPPPLLLYSPGSYVRDFTASCGAGERPVWQVFQWQAKVPTGTSIDFQAGTASTTAALATATQVTIGRADPPDTNGWSNNPVNIESQLKAINQTSQKYLRVTMKLNPSSDKLSSPVLTNWRVIYDCLDSE